MSHTTDRADFIATLARHGISARTALALMRDATTLQKYAELACSSVAADRDRIPCPASRPRSQAARPDRPCLCEDWPEGSHALGVHGDVPRYRVLEARVERRLAALCEANGLLPAFQGDPRGAVFSVAFPDDPTRTYYVPAQGFTVAEMERIEARDRAVYA